MEETHVPKVVSSNPGTVYWMDIFSHLFVAKLKRVFEKTKINEKEVWVGALFSIRHGLLKFATTKFKLRVV